MRICFRFLFIFYTQNFFRSFRHRRIYDTTLGSRDRGGYPERHGEGAEEGLVLENSSSWMNRGEFYIATCQANSICDKGSDKNIFICLISDWIHLNQWNYTLSGYKWDTTQMSSNLFKIASLDFKNFNLYTSSGMNTA